MCLFSEDEVWDTIKHLPTDKAPGPDSYTGRFYRCCWETIKADLMATLLVLHQGDRRKLGLLNATFLTLLPKKANAIEAKDFRPISLIHSFAKLVVKLMANRLAPRLSSLVSPNQSAFV